MTPRDRARAELRADVALMRELGVARWGEIYLGPPPVKSEAEMSPEERAARAELSERRRHDVLFAATSLRPEFPTRTQRRAFSADNVVPRGESAPKHGDGPDAG